MQTFPHSRVKFSRTIFLLISYEWRAVIQLKSGTWPTKSMSTCESSTILCVRSTCESSRWRSILNHNETKLHIWVQRCRTAFSSAGNSFSRLFRMLFYGRTCIFCVTKKKKAKSEISNKCAAAGWDEPEWTQAQIWRGRGRAIEMIGWRVCVFLSLSHFWVSGFHLI